MCKLIFSPSRGAIFLMATLMAAACSKEPAEFPEPGEAVMVNFVVPGVEQTTGATKAGEALAEGTTVRIAAYYHDPGNPQLSTLCKEVTYCVRDGKLVPCTVDENGNFTAFGGQDMELSSYAYDFYSVSPALPLSTDKRLVSKVPHGVDYATSVTANQNISTSKVQTVSLTTLSRRCAKVDFVVKRADGVTEPSTLSVNELTVGGLRPTCTNVAIISSVPAGVGSTTYVLPGEAFTSSGATTASASAFLLPASGAGPITFDYKLSCTIGGYESNETFSGEVPSLNLEAGKRYTVTLTVRLNTAGLAFEVRQVIDNSTDIGE